MKETAEPVDCPSHHHIKPAPASVLQHCVKCRPLVAALGAADAGIAVRRQPANHDVAGRAARSEVSYEQQDKIGDPRCLDYLVAAMESQDAKVTENSASAVARAALFYCRDWRAWKPALGLLQSNRQSIRRWAVDVAAYLGRERAIDAILPLFADEAELVRIEVGAMLIWMARAGHLSTASRNHLAAELARSLPDRELEMRCRMIGVVRELNVKFGIKPLRAALKNEQHKSVRAYIGHAIRCLGAGNPSLPM